MKPTQTRHPAEAKARDAAQHPQPAAEVIIPREEAIRERAYQIFLARGGVPGSALQDWLRAEQELRSQSRP
jgi:hypothetical protein